MHGKRHTMHTSKFYLADLSLKPLKKTIIKNFSASVRFIDQERRNNFLDTNNNNDEDFSLLLPGPINITSSPFPASVLTLPVSAQGTSKQGTSSSISKIFTELSRIISDAELCKAKKILSIWRKKKPDPWYKLDFDQKISLGKFNKDRLRHTASGDLEQCCSLKFSEEELNLTLFAALSGWQFTAPLQEFVETRDHFDVGLVAAHILSKHVKWFSAYNQECISMVSALESADLFKQRHMENASLSFCTGAQSWNHQSINALFSGAGGPVTFCKSAQEAVERATEKGGRVISWAARTDQETIDACTSKGVPLIRIEDGFLRSVGLGAGLAKGASLVVDNLGIHFDPSCPSRLEHLLQTYEFSEEELTRAAQLKAAIVKARVSKYNVGKSGTFAFPQDRKIILVPGQVADDAAIRKSISDTIKSVHTVNVNESLLKLARQRNPDAFIVFKPHPDVETGLRKGVVPAEILNQNADFVAKKTDIVDLIDACDQVETFSSLAGFEALMRDVSVTVHGLPFYAGWGQTTDLSHCARRTRVRTVEEIVFLAYAVYSRTIDPHTLLPCSPEFLITRLTSQRKSSFNWLITTAKRELSWLGRKLNI